LTKSWLKTWYVSQALNLQIQEKQSEPHGE
jgi:hypothetical protein